MSVADQPAQLTNLARRVPFTVRFSPQFINRMCDRLQKSAPTRANVAGLLFGRSELAVSEIHVFKSFPDSPGNGNISAQPDHLAALVQALIASSRHDPEVSALQLLGWYAFRGSGGLHESDVAFHNGYFRQPNEIALILRPEQHPNVLFEIYSKAGTTLLSEDEHRWGSLRLPTDTTVAGPVDVAMRAKIGDDFYLRAYQVSKTLDRAERREHWVSAVEATKSTVRSIFRQKRKETYAREAAAAQNDNSLLQAEPPIAPAPLARAAAATAAEPPVTLRPAIQRVPSPAAAPPPEALFAKPDPFFAKPAAVPAPAFTKPFNDRELTPPRASATLQKIYAGDPPALPAVVKPPRRSVPWLSSVIMFAITAGATYALYGFATNGETPRFLRAIFPDTGLGLRVEGQGDRVLLSWNRRNAVVRSSQGGVLHIDDGAQHRDVRLDPAQIANGSVLYRPGSDDVSFRLQVHGQQGASVADTMRVLDGAKAPPLEVKSVPPDLSPSIPAAPPPPATTVNAFEPRSRREAALEPPVATRPSYPPAAPPSSLTGRTRIPENRSAYTRDTSPPPASLVPPTSVTPPRTEPALPTPGTLTASRSTQTAAPAPVKPSDARPLSPPPQGLAETPRSSPGGSPDTTRPPDTSKLSSWEESPSGRPAEPAQPRTGPGNAPSPAPSASLPTLTPENRPAPAFVPPKPVKQVLPDLRSFAPGAIGPTSQVEVAVRVNKKGRVTDAYLVGDGGKVPQHLARAALGAAKQWTFEPATIRGKTVASDHTIVFEFRPAGH